MSNLTTGNCSSQNSQPDVELIGDDDIHIDDNSLCGYAQFDNAIHVEFEI